LWIAGAIGRRFVCERLAELKQCGTIG